MFPVQLILFASLSLLFLTVSYWAVKQTLLFGKWEYCIYILLLYFPVYTVYLSVAYGVTASVPVVKGLQLYKDLIVLFAIGAFVLYQRDFWAYPFKLNALDKAYLAFIFLAVVFLFLPVGEASFVNKAFYLKGLLIPALVYTMGRNTRFSDGEIKRVFHIIFGIVIAAFVVNLLEIALDTHFQTLTGYANFNQAINDVAPSGNFGLTWTFETQAVTKRLGSLFSDPLELASSVLLGFAAGLIWYLTSKREDSVPYLIVMLCALASLFLASSRAAFGAFFIMLFFVAIIFRLYKLILFGASMGVLFVVFVIFFASEDFYFFVLDTITFENASSMGHLIEWLVALDSMIANPLGIGLAMSGNMGSVTDDVRVGGENQFLIYGVQMGIPGMLLYIVMLYLGIKLSIRVFRSSDNVMTARVAFTGAAVKAGLLLPLFTANAEMYAYVSWISWWMIGYALNQKPQVVDGKA